MEKERKNEITVKIYRAGIKNLLRYPYELGYLVDEIHLATGYPKAEIRVFLKILYLEELFPNIIAELEKPAPIPEKKKREKGPLVL